MVKLPIEYKKRFVKFLGCEIDLSKRPFIPRIETEYWVKKAINEIKKSGAKGQKLEVLDVFAGSGCIGIAILKACPELCQRVDFVDIDKKTIEQIKINLKMNKISTRRYNIYQSNIFNKVKKEYDIIFANPPYVAEERIKEIQKSVLKYEPKKALLSGKKGLKHIKRFLKEAKFFLKKEGTIYLEFDPFQKVEIKEVLKKEGYKDFKFFRDQFKKYRWLKAARPKRLEKK